MCKWLEIIYDKNIPFSEIRYCKKYKHECDSCKDMQTKLNEGGVMMKIEFIKAPYIYTEEGK